MYIVIEMTANRTDPQGYGGFVKIHSDLTSGSLHEQEFADVYHEVCKLLGVEQAKMIHTMGVYGASNAGMAYEDVKSDGEVQLFTEFQDRRRVWIFEVPAE